MTATPPVKHWISCDEHDPAQTCQSTHSARTVASSQYTHVYSNPFIDIPIVSEASLPGSAHSSLPDSTTPSPPLPDSPLLPSDILDSDDDDDDDDDIDEVISLTSISPGEMECEWQRLTADAALCAHNARKAARLLNTTIEEANVLGERLLALDAELAGKRLKVRTAQGKQRQAILEQRSTVSEQRAGVSEALYRKRVHHSQVAGWEKSFRQRADYLYRKAWALEEKLGITGSPSTWR
ncbi:hypothetical protein DXG01_007081 [Tephrocybe rancida]|nr:hypothetical protein DXG01_007081 [Tephrocybe rancida]